MSLGVVITTYNRPEKLERCLEHIESQTHLPDEVVIVNDGSQMDYAEVQARFSDSRFKWLTIKNQGVSAARNRGISISTADYICLCDDDDYFLPHHIAEFHNIIESLQCPSIVFSHFMELRGTELMPHHAYPKPEHMTWQEHLVSQGMMVVCCTCMPRIAFIQHPFPEGVKYAEDHEQRLLAMSQYPVKELHSHTAVVDRTDESATNQSVANIASTYRRRFKTLFSHPSIRPHIRPSIRKAQVFRWTSLHLHELLNEGQLTILDILRGLKQIRSLHNARSMAFILRRWAIAKNKAANSPNAL